jgi:predicted O-methyltransferase YrrM
MYQKWNTYLDVDIDSSRIGRGALGGHISTIYWECVRCSPQLVVEIGVRGGQSTAVFCHLAPKYSGTVISVDVEETEFTTSYLNWHFFRERGDAVGARFSQIRSDLGVGPVDILFLDSSHLYDDTVAELRAWLPHLAVDGLIMCHDTAMATVYRGSDGTFRRGWDNRRGVVKALEDVLGISLKEDRSFVTRQNGWVISHTPVSSGFTMLLRETV